jgi:hypothetical protein
MSLFLPVALIVGFRLFSNRSLLMLAVYYFLTAVYNLMVQDYLPVPQQVRIFFGTMNNYLDAPLMLMFLMFFCTDKVRSKAMHITLYGLAAYELVIVLLYGFHRDANVLILGPGILAVLVFSIAFFVKQIKWTILMGKGVGKTVMLASVVFAYGCFGIVYVFHYINKMSNLADIFLIYFISSFISTLLMARGLVLIRRHLNELKEVQVARRELQVFFNHPVTGNK